MYNNEKSFMIIGNINSINTDKYVDLDNYIIVENNLSSEVYSFNTLYFDIDKMNKITKAYIIKDKIHIATIDNMSLSKILHYTSFDRNCDMAKYFDAIEIKQFVPLFCINQIRNITYIFSQLRFSDSEIIFINTLEVSGDNRNICEYIKDAIEVHKKNHVFLGNHQCYYYGKNESEFEIEYKFNIINKEDPWILISDLYNEVRAAKMKDYIFEYGDGFQKWDYDNYMFQICGDSSEKGYISFIPQTNGTYLIKRKIYEKDSLARRELHYKNVEINIPLHEYVKERFKVEFKQFPPFRRIRYDLNIECLKTGNVHGIFFDYITIDGLPNELRQCEIEYLRTRSLKVNNEHRNELLFLKGYIENFLKCNQIKYENTFYSKLSFMEDVVKYHEKN